MVVSPRELSWVPDLTPGACFSWAIREIGDRLQGKDER